MDNDFILDALAAEIPGVVVGFTLVVNYVDDRGEDHLIFTGLENQRATTTIGLLTAALELEKSKFRFDY